MPLSRLVRLAQDLEWLGCELEHQGKKHAHEGYPGKGATWETFKAMREGVLATCDKIDRELKSSVSFNPTSVAGIEYPLEATLDAIGLQLSAVGDIREAALNAVHELPTRVRGFARMVETFVSATGTMNK